MEIEQYTFISWVHIISALVAMVVGALVLLSTKGTARHKKLGYAYAVSMILMNATAFGIYRLMGTFGPFHVAALVSAVTLFFGLRAAMAKPRKANWIYYHLSFMYWSVIGLYAAFFSEMAVRVNLPGSFGILVLSATGLTILAGFIGHRYLMKKWVA